MNDRLKYRVWDKIHEKYFYCDLVGYGSIDKSGKGLKKIIFRPSGVEQLLNDEKIFYADEDDVVIEQCTGLKDKNSTLIYEGDIIEKQNQKFVIKYDFDSFVAYSEEKKPVSIYGLFTLKLCFGGWPEKETENTIEVIGNIHENPEILEQSNDNR